nr:PREDICTED: uncharacterized protein LOC104210294 [Nicotiana sylvestris]
MACVSTVSYSLLINGGLTTRFQAKKGLRQVDPMSLYLFVLAMEYLNRSLKNLKQNPDFNYHLICSKLDLVHIYFVDNLLICCREDRISILLMLQTFNHFSEVSRLKANMDKSSLYVAGVSSEFKHQIIQEMGFSAGEMPFRYLGVPISSRKLTIHQYLLGSNLSIAKKDHQYGNKYMQNIPMDNTNKVSRKALVAWEKLCMPRSAGGLNILDFYKWNKSAICKLLWVITQKKDNLWEDIGSKELASESWGPLGTVKKL